MEIASLTHCLPALILFYLYKGSQANCNFDDDDDDDVDVEILMTGHRF